MDYKKKLSLIIPVYGTEKYLSKCLDSVIAAVDRQMEVIIINDGSPDNSEKIILDYQKKYPDVFTYYKKDNGGLSDVKNYGLSRCNGEYVIFLDSDDYVDKEMYKDMLEKAEEENADIVICDVIMNYEDGTPPSLVPCDNKNRKDKLYSVLDTWVMPASWNKLVKRELYLNLEFPKGLNNEDVCVTPILLAKAKRIEVINKPYYHYVQRKGSIQNSGFSEKRFVILDTVKIAIDRLNEIDQTKQQMVKNTLFLHQVLSMAMYPIREVEDIKERERLLEKYMERVYMLFPDFMDTPVFKELICWGNPIIRAYRRVSLQLLKKRKYYTTCIFWQVYNWMYALYRNLRKGE